MKGDMFEAQTEAIVNTVNTVGVMGKGVALQFKKRYPDNFNSYLKAIEDNNIDIGKLFVTNAPSLFHKYIINFPTKKHWRHPSKYEYVEKGMIDLIRIIEEKDIRSVAIPPLGAGNGKLDWRKVKPIIEKYAQKLPDVEFLIFVPQDRFKSRDNIKNQNAKLTNTRALLLMAFFNYDSQSDELTLLAAQKIAYFFQRFNQPMRLKYTKGWYGPYSHNLNKVLQAMNGVYITYNSANVTPANIIELNYKKQSEIIQYTNSLDAADMVAYHKLYDFMSGFETPFSLELLATVDWILRKHPEFNADEVYADIQNWTRRKAEIIKKHHVTVAFNHLQKYEQDLNESNTTTKTSPVRTI